jgi:plastocyanin
VKGPGRGILWLLGIAVAACGGGGGTSPDHTPSQVLVSAGDNQVGSAGQELAAPLEVTVKDASGSPLSGITVAWATASGGGTVTPSSTTTADGKATATRRLGPGAGAQTTTATVSGVAPATFHHVAQIQGATQIAANVGLTRSDSVLSTVPFSVVVRDQNSQAVAGVTVTWSLSGGGGNLSQPTSITDASGIASVNLTLDQVTAPRSVQAAVTGLQGSPVQFTENGVAGNATQMAQSSGNFQAGPAGGDLATQLGVLVKDAHGNVKPGVTVTWAVFGGGSVSPATPVTNASGVASVTRTLGATAGVYRDTASVTGLSGSPVAFEDTAGAVDTIQVRDNFFSPVHDTVTVGTFVVFRWLGAAQHSVVWQTTPAPTPSNSSIMATGTFVVRMTKVGTYNYLCGVHGAIMPGDIVSQ